MVYILSGRLRQVLEYIASHKIANEFVDKSNWCQFGGLEKNAVKVLTTGCQNCKFSAIINPDDNLILKSVWRTVKVVRDPCQKITLLLLESKSVGVIVPESCF